MNKMELKAAMRRLGRTTKNTAGLAALLLSVGFSQPAQAATQTHKITAPDGATSDFFGYSVLLSEGELFVGAQGRLDRNGAVYVYSAQDGYASPSSIIEPPEGTKNYFGTRILRQGDFLFVSAQRSSAGAPRAGAVYIYQKEASGAWSLSQTLTAQDAASNDWFGNSLAIENDRLLIGAPRRDFEGTFDAGAVYAFSRDAGGQWTQTAILTAEAPTSQGLFGASVALRDGRALVGMPGHDLEVNADGQNQTITDAGVAYAYSVNSSGAWELAQTLESSAPSERAGFGTSLAMAQEQAVVAAPNDSSGGSVYALKDEEGAWTIAQRLQPADGFQGLQFGFSLSLSPNGQHLVVGAPGATTPGFDSGEIHVFKAQGAGNFSADGPVLETDDLASRDFLGAAVSATDDEMVIAGVRLDDDQGSSSGSVYIFGPEDAPAAPVAPFGALLLGFGGLVALRRSAWSR